MTTRPVLPVSLLICTRNRPEMLATAVNSVLDGASLPGEIVIVDQSATRQRLPTPPAGCEIAYLHHPGRGLSRARNIGLDATRFDRVAIIDDDMLVEPDWLERLAAACEGTSEVVTGRVLRHVGEPDRFPVPDAALITRADPMVWRGEVDRDVVPGAGLMLPRQAVLDIGGYDERMGAGSPFGGAEDNDLGLRLLRAGCSVRHEPSAVAWHRGRLQRSAVIGTSWAYGVGKGAFYSKHFASPALRRRMLRDTVRRFGRALVRLPRDRGGAAGDAVFAVGVLAGSVRWWAGGHWRRPVRAR